MDFVSVQRKIIGAIESEWHKHPYGGGWVKNTATVDETAYIGDKAIVGGNAHVGKRAQIGGDAVIIDNVHVGESAVVRGRIHLTGTASVRHGTVTVKGDAHIGCGL